MKSNGAFCSSLVAGGDAGAGERHRGMNRRQIRRWRQAPRCSETMADLPVSLLRNNLALIRSRVRPPCTLPPGAHRGTDRIARPGLVPGQLIASLSRPPHRRRLRQPFGAQVVGCSGRTAPQQQPTIARPTAMMLAAPRTPLAKPLTVAAQRSRLGMNGWRSTLISEALDHRRVDLQSRRYRIRRPPAEYPLSPVDQSGGSGMLARGAILTSGGIRPDRGIIADALPLLIPSAGASLAPDLTRRADLCREDAGAAPCIGQIR